MKVLLLAGVFGRARCRATAAAQDAGLAAKVEALGQVNGATSPSLSPGLPLAFER